MKHSTILADRPMVSVIIPVYNGEKYLQHAVESVLTQPFRNLEVICVNDGSTDGSLTILKRLAEQDNKVRVFTQINQGVASARNYGMEQAQGHYFAFLDQDDCYCKNALTDDLLECVSAERYDMVSFAYFDSNQDMSRGREHTRGSGERRCFSDFAGENYRHHSSYLFNTAFVRANNILTDCYRNEDERFRMQCVYAADRVLYVERPLFAYRNNVGSVTHQRGKNTIVLDSCYQGFSQLSKKAVDIKIRQYCYDTMLRLLLDMAKGMVMEGDSAEMIAKALADRQVDMLYMSKSWLSDGDRRDWELIFNKTGCFVTKYKLVGMIMNGLRAIQSCSLIRKYYEMLKYPDVLEGKI